MIALLRRRSACLGYLSAVAVVVFAMQMACGGVAFAGDEDPVEPEAVSREAMAKELALVFNQPNPFNAHTMILYKLLRPAKVKIDIYDLAGRHVIKILDEFQEDGENFAVWKTSHSPSGTYVFCLQVEGIRIFRKMSLVK